MRQQAIQYLAMDVHQATVVACVRDERGTITMRATVPTEARAILSLVREAGARVHVAFEEETQAQWLHDLLQPYAERSWSATSAARARSRTRAIASMRCRQNGPAFGWRAHGTEL